MCQHECPEEFEAAGRRYQMWSVINQDGICPAPPHPPPTPTAIRLVAELHEKINTAVIFVR